MFLSLLTSGLIPKVEGRGTKMWLVSSSFDKLRVHCWVKREGRVELRSEPKNNKTQMQSSSRFSLNAQIEGRAPVTILNRYIKICISNNSPYNVRTSSCIKYLTVYLRISKQHRDNVLVLFLLIKYKF